MSIVVCCVVWSAHAVAQDECVPAALIDGPTHLVEPIREMLAQRGIVQKTTESCDITIAHISQQDRQIMVSIEQTDGAPEDRLVSDTVTATTVIESWARGLLANPLLKPEFPRPAQPERVSVDVVNVINDYPHESNEPQKTQLGIGGGFFVGRTADGSTWFEPQLEACVALSPKWCVGAQIIGRLDTQMSGQSTRLDTNRLGVDVTLTADYLVIEKPSVAVGPSVGAGWLRSRFSGEEAAGQTVDVDAGGLRVGAHVTLLIPAADHLNMTLGARVSYSPLAPSKPYRQDNFEIAGDSRWGVSAGVGVHYGTP